MEMVASRDIAADRAAVWAALMDAATLQACVPGCQNMTGTAAEGFEAVVVQKVGPVKATFTGSITLSDIVESESLTLKGSGSGKAAGFAKGEAHVRLQAIEGGTRLSYDVKAQVGGKLAQLGSRIIDSFARKMADDFFTRFQHALEPPAEPSEGDPEETAAQDPTPKGADKKQGWFKRVLSR
ncbi:MAG: carbon monoxide dehydrogenase subunit G [Rhodobacteraceae bacterium]|nr:carbon monoxide dehydrogenase subunit G [Paracoccaceae bacterium]